MRRRAALALAACGLLMAVPLRAGAAGYAARVERVFDGDTVWVRPLSGSQRPRKLRLDGIDAPEICQNGGLRSRDALASRVQHRVVRVHERAQDHWGRGLARLEHQGEDVNGWLVRGGLAWSERWRGQHPYGLAEAQARRERLGVFTDRGAQSPRAFRRHHGPCEPPRTPGSPAGAAARSR